MIIPKKNLMSVAKDTITDKEYLDLAFEMAEQNIEGVLTEALIDARIYGMSNLRISYLEYVGNVNGTLLGDIEKHLTDGYVQVLKDNGYSQKSADWKSETLFPDVADHEVVLTRLAWMLESVGYTVEYTKETSYNKWILSLSVNIEEED